MLKYFEKDWSTDIGLYFPNLEWSSPLKTDVTTAIFN